MLPLGKADGSQSSRLCPITLCGGDPPWQFVVLLIDNAAEAAMFAVGLAVRANLHKTCSCRVSWACCRLYQIDREVIGSVICRRLPLSAVTLVAANLVPLVAIFLLGWDTGVIVFLYWAENVIVGTLSILKIALLKGDSSRAHASKLLAIPFFCFHYGMFCAGHGFFLGSFFDFPQGIERLLPEFSGIGSIFLPILAGSLARGVAAASLGVIGWTILALLASHAVSFLWNFVWHGEYQSFSVGQSMIQPYLRMAALHVVIIVGGILISLTGSPVFLLVVLVVAKIGLDLFFHAREHAGKPTGGAPSSRA